MGVREGQVEGESKMRHTSSATHRFTGPVRNFPNLRHRTGKEVEWAYSSFKLYESNSLSMCTITVVNLVMTR